MRRLIAYLSTLIVVAVLCGCTYNASFMCGDKNVATMSPPKTIDVSPELQGNVPMQGGTVTNPQQSQAGK